MDAVPLLPTSTATAAPAGSAVLHMTSMEPSPPLQEQHASDQGAAWCACWRGRAAARHPPARSASGTSSGNLLRKVAMGAGECDMAGEELCPPASLPSGTRPTDPDVNALVHL
jgi:hypothetical protein